MIGGGMFLNMILWVVILGFIIYGIVVLITKPFLKIEKKEDSSVQILKKGIARGEMDDWNLRIN
ncbi:hypothetical protein WMZ97_21700 [Lentibacillus sp. N15]|uniref:hypothetical protein n=1 Tax=Lentibacillus songyuanensis TaxID=3136161 RepID=UPI0031BA74DF